MADQVNAFLTALSRYGHDVAALKTPGTSPVTLARQHGVPESHLTGAFECISYPVVHQAVPSDSEDGLLVGEHAGDWVYAHPDPFDPALENFGIVAFAATAVAEPVPSLQSARTPTARPQVPVHTLMQALYVLGRGDISPAELDQPNYHKILLQSGRITHDDIAEAYARLTGVEYIDVRRRPPEPDVRTVIAATTVTKFRVVPHHMVDGELVVLVDQPTDHYPLTAVQQETGNDRVKMAVTSASELERLIVSLYRRAEQDEALRKEAAQRQSETADGGADPDGAVAQRIRLALHEAVYQDASDIHFQHESHGMVIRYRIDGHLVTVSQVPNELGTQVTNQLMMMCGMNIESRIPLDAKFSYRINQQGKESTVRFRVASLPNIHGTDITMRLLQEVENLPGLENSGFSPHNLDLLMSAVSASKGMVLVTGPTGSGKTTLMHDFIRTVNTPALKIVTVENPVEYVQPGVVQVEVKLTEDDRTSLTFHRALRAFVRQDPDVIFVGEIRDPETAKVAVEASNTGHLLLSTLHTTSAIGTVARMAELGVEPYLLADNLRLIVAQRLIGRPCPECSVEEPLPERYAAALGRQAVMKRGTKVTADGRPCPLCHGSGDYKQMAVHEVLHISDDIRAAIRAGSIGEVEVLAQEQGFKTMLLDGLEKVASGQLNLASLIDRTK